MTPEGFVSRSTIEASAIDHVIEVEQSNDHGCGRPREERGAERPREPRVTAQFDRDGHRHDEDVQQQDHGAHAVERVEDVRGGERHGRLPRSTSRAEPAISSIGRLTRLSAEAPA